MFRNRLKGGHKVGANTFQQSSQVQSAPIQQQQTGGWGTTQQQYANPPMQPGQPYSQAPSSTSDNSWGWDEQDSWSNKSGQDLNTQQGQINQRSQPPLNQHPQHAINQQHSQPPVPQYSHQSQAYQQQLQPTSSQQFSKTSSPEINSNQHANNIPSSSPSLNAYPTSQSQQFPQHPPSASSQQFVNGNAQNGNGVDDWGNDNWGNDWSQQETNINNNKASNYSNQEPIQSQHHYSQQHHQQHQQQQQYNTQQYSHQQNYQQDVQQQYQHQNTHGHQYKQSNSEQPPQYTQNQITSVENQTDTATEDAWGWDNDSWDVNNKDDDQQSLNNYQQPSQFLSQAPGAQPTSAVPQFQPPVSQPTSAVPQFQPPVSQPLSAVPQFQPPVSQFQPPVSQPQPLVSQPHPPMSQPHPPVSQSQPQSNIEGPPESISNMFDVNASERAPSRDTAGDGWPDWESIDQPPSEAPPHAEQQHQYQLQQEQHNQLQQEEHHQLQKEQPVQLQDQHQYEQGNQQQYQYGQQQHHLQYEQGDQQQAYQQFYQHQELDNQPQQHQEHSRDANAIQEPTHSHQHDPQVQQGHQCDDGLEHTGDLQENSANVPLTGTTSHQAATDQSNVQFHKKQDSWGSGWDDATPVVSTHEQFNPLVTENVSGDMHTQVGPTQASHVETGGEIKGNSHDVHEGVSNSNVDIPISEEGSQMVNSTVSAPPLTDNWDDDGWGDGWDAESSAAIQDMPTATEEDTEKHKEKDFSSGQQLDTNKQQSDVSIEQGNYSGVSDQHQQMSYETPQNQGQTGANEGAWENDGQNDVEEDLNFDASNTGLESVTQGMGAMILSENQFGINASATNEQKDSKSESFHHQEHPTPLDLSYYQGYQMQPGMYPVPPAGMTSHSNWSQNPEVQGTESQVNAKWPAEHYYQDPHLQNPQISVQSKAAVKASPVPEPGSASPCPPLVPGPHVVDPNAEPIPSPSPQIIDQNPQPSFNIPDAPQSVTPPSSVDSSQYVPKNVSAYGTTSIDSSVDPQDPMHQYPSYHPNQHQDYSQYQGLNQEIVSDHSSRGSSEVPDPMMSRIPDGASAVVETPVIKTAAETSHRVTSADMRNSISENSDRPSSTQSAQSVNLQPSHIPSQPNHPLSTHSYPERPASNQSAHSVRSTHSVQSAYSNRSTQSSHSLLSQNQEVPLNEASKMTVAVSQSDLHQEQKILDRKEMISEDRGIDPTAPPGNHPVAPPPFGGPIGSITSLRARKGSPFQPPHGMQPQAVPTSMVQSHFAPLPPSSTSPLPPSSKVTYLDNVSANLEMPPDNNEQPVNADSNSVPLWTGSENLTSNVKLAVAAPSIDTTPSIHPLVDNKSETAGAAITQPSAPSSSVSTVANNPIPLVVPGLIKEESSAGSIDLQQGAWVQPEPPAAHNSQPQTTSVMPKPQSLSGAANSSMMTGVLDLSRSSRSSSVSRGDGSQNKTETPNFSRMVPGESSKGESASVSSYQAPAVVPSMPSERVVTGNDDPQPVLPVRIKQEPSEVRSPPDGPYTSDLSSQGASVVPPVRSETIGSEEPTSHNFASANSGSRPDLTSEHRSDRGGRWGERDHSRDRENRSNDHYRERSREHSRDYYRDDSPHSRRSYDRDYDYKYDSDRRIWRHESEDDTDDGDRRYYESRDRRDRAYRDELDRYSDRPIKEEKDRSHRESSRDKRRSYRDKSKDYYDDDPYYGRSDRSQPVSRSSSMEGDRSGLTHRSRHDYYDRHDRGSHSRDRDGHYSRSKHRDRDSSFTGDGRDSRDPRRDPRHYGQRGYDESYSQREMYDQYNYYYQYYRDHPYYKEYYRQWMKQYGHAYPSHDSSFYDDRNSIHSGRSSVNDELKKSISSPRGAYDPYSYYYANTSQPPQSSSSQFMQDFHGRSSVGPYEPSAIYPDGSFSQLKSYASGELSGVPSVTGDSVSEPPQRLTPVQHGRPHINARFTQSGQLLFVLPMDPRDGEKAVVQLRDVQKMLCRNPSLNRAVQQMKNYPGPLTLSDTHKDVVVKYCEQQAVEASRNRTLPDNESVTLMWEYLGLLVKQNGKLHGSDVAGLLLKGQDTTPQPQSTVSQTPSDDGIDPTLDQSPQDEGIDLQSHSTPLPPPRDEMALLKKFTEYLMLGRKKEAVDYAMREGLWGHALALSYKMDSTTHTRVLAAFANAIPRNDVLMTLFQQLSGKKPEVAKNYTPQQWGNWRKHLAMMVSNPTGQSQRDKASVVALGDTLSSRGQLHAAHFCYLVADAEWGCFSNKDSKLVLIGSSHHLAFQAFATNEAIQCTEIFEFARSLDSSNPLLETFQSYKLIYALRLAEFGFPSEALRYCEVISHIVSRSPHSYQGVFLSQVYELGLRLKYHDLHYQMYEGEMTEIADPKWLTDLANVVATVRHQEAEIAALQVSQGHQSVGQEYPSMNTYQGSSATPDLYPSIGSQANDQYQMGYGMANATQQQGQGTPDSYQGHVASTDTNDGGYSQQITKYPPSAETAEEPQVHNIQNDTTKITESGNFTQENTPPQPETVPMMMQPQQNESQYAPYSNNYWPGYTPQEPNASPQFMQPDSAEVSHSSLPASPEVGNENRSGSVASVSQPNSLNSYPGYQQPYQPWGQNTESPNTSADQQSMSPEPAKTSHRSPEEEAYWAEMTGKKKSSDLPTSSESETTSNEKEKKEEDKTKKDSKDNSQEKGWSIGSLFGWKKSKQAVLPDDKNPSIVWNEEKKRWESKDGGEELHSPPPPPPKFAPMGPGAPPINLARGGPRKLRYVNTEKDTSKGPPNGPTPPLPPMSGGPPISVTPPMVPSGAPAPPTFMVPGPAPPQQQERDSSPQQPDQRQQQPLTQLPTTVPDSSLGTSNDGGEGAVPMMAPPVGQPQFFNPMQFNPPSTAPNPSQTRRVGPGKRLYQGKR